MCSTSVSVASDLHQQLSTPQGDYQVYKNECYTTTEFSRKRQKMEDDLTDTSCDISFGPYDVDKFEDTYCNNCKDKCTKELLVDNGANTWINNIDHENISLDKSDDVSLVRRKRKRSDGEIIVEKQVKTQKLDTIIESTTARNQSLNKAIKNEDNDDQVIHEYCDYTHSTTGVCINPETDSHTIDINCSTKTSEKYRDINNHDEYDQSYQSYWKGKRQTLQIAYWSRTDECKERKWDHLDEIAEKYGCAEDHIFATTLYGRKAYLEPNMFPYDTPTGIEHWTLWHEKELTDEQVVQYVENWIECNAPHVVPSDSSVLKSRKVEELNHDMNV